MFGGPLVKASETTFAGFVQGQVQFQIPLYQRTYSWGEAQLQQLWDDIVDQADLLAATPESAVALFHATG